MVDRVAAEALRQICAPPIRVRGRGMGRNLSLIRGSNSLRGRGRDRVRTCGICTNAD